MLMAPAVSGRCKPLRVIDGSGLRPRIFPGLVDVEEARAGAEQGKALTRRGIESGESKQNDG